MFHGVMTALVTPFYQQKNGRLLIDEDRHFAHLERQIAAGVDALVIAGTTGEAATLSMQEHKHLIAISVAYINGRVATIAGTGSNNTEESIELTRAAKDAGADAALVITPYYNKPSQEGLIAHYRCIHDNVHIPLILYNVPGRTQADLLPSTVAKLAELPNVVGLKDATGDMVRLTQTMNACRPGMEFYSGDDGSVLPFMAIGGRGVISVVSNIAPKTMGRLVRCMASGDWAGAREAHRALQPLSDILFCQSNPIPVKAACSLLGWMDNTLRLPLTPMGGDQLNDFKHAIQMIRLKDDTITF
ncbi:MAG: 4-hydroxy-tetrahydrodipicolinate synthase [Mariprofundaceae bacterium]|nr:4-hydroxy-tetrahydrodipicolinate synthase [Mariprofundaceae bacterium]